MPRIDSTLAVCAGYSDRRNDNLTGQTRFKLAAIAVGESNRRLVVSAGYKNVATPIVPGFARRNGSRWRTLFTHF